MFVQLFVVLYISLPLLTGNPFVGWQWFKTSWKLNFTHVVCTYCMAQHKMLLLIPQCKEQWALTYVTHHYCVAVFCVLVQTYLPTYLYLHSYIGDRMSTWPHHQMCVCVWFCLCLKGFAVCSLCVCVCSATIVDSCGGMETSWLSVFTLSMTLCVCVCACVHACASVCFLSHNDSFGEQ